MKIRCPSFADTSRTRSFFHPVRIRKKAIQVDPALRVNLHALGLESLALCFEPIASGQRDRASLIDHPPPRQTFRLGTRIQHAGHLTRRARITGPRRDPAIRRNPPARNRANDIYQLLREATSHSRPSIMSWKRASPISSAVTLQRIPPAWLDKWQRHGVLMPWGVVLMEPREPPATEKFPPTRV